MEQQWKAFAERYDAAGSRSGEESAGGRRRLHHPLVVAVVGDAGLETLAALRREHAAQWSNSGAVVYVHIYAHHTLPADEVIGVRLADAACEDRKTGRARLCERLLDDATALAELNRAMRQAARGAAGLGRLVPSMRQLQLAVVTVADDPFAVLLPEATLLLRAVLRESFKQIQSDLFVLLRDHLDGDDAYARAATVACLRELDACQAKDYRYAAPIHVTGEHIRLSVEHGPSPLFDLVYLLGDRSERGRFVEGGQQTSGQLIASICLLKNSQPSESGDPAGEGYNNERFRQHIASGSAKPVYATAGRAAIRKPGQAIALTVLHRLVARLIGRLREQSETESTAPLDLWRLDPAALDASVDAIAGDGGKLEEMHGLLAASVSAGEWKRRTVGEAERLLYGTNADEFFRKHVVEPARRRLEALGLERELGDTAEQAIVGNPSLGLYCAVVWTADTEESPVHTALRQWRKETEQRLADGRLQLEQRRSEPADRKPYRRMPLFGSSPIRTFSRLLFEDVYGFRLDLLRLELKLALLRRYETAFARLHETMRVRFAAILELERRLAAASKQSVSEADDYLGFNIPEYYESVVDSVLQQLQEKRGDDFWFEERFAGTVTGASEEAVRQLLDRLIDLCEREMLRHPAFGQTFDEELMQRANVAVRYGEQREVLAREQLYRELYETLSEQAEPHIEVYDYTHRHRYEEHYLLGNAESDFIRYALETGRARETGKLACLHEPRHDGVVRLGLMGGFGTADLLMYQNGLKYYDSYCANGFLFHARRPEGAENGVST